MGPLRVVVLLGAGLGLWWTASALLGVPSYILPSPQAVLTELWEDAGSFGKHLLWTVGEALGGLVVAVLGGLIVAGALFLFPWFEELLMPVIVGLKAVPLVALAPLFLIWFGSGVVSKALMAATICFFPLVVGLVKGFRACSDDEVLFLRDVKLSRWEELVRFRIWKAMPFFLAGLRVASVLAVVGAIVGEFTGAKGGLGYVVTVAAVRIDTPLLFVGIFLSAGCGLALYGAAVGFERIALRHLQMEPLNE